MFIDICFPEKNEEKFVEIANKLSTSNLVFLYESKKDKDNYFGYLSKNSKNPPVIKLMPLVRDISKDPKQHYFYCGDKKATFHAPIKKMNQVVFKDLAEKKKFLGLPFSYLLKNSPRYIEQLTFVVKLCEKYGVNMFFSSFASAPYELRSKYDLMSFARIIGIDKKNIKTHIKDFHNFLK